MNQEKIGKLIKDLRVKNNLTQTEFAQKYNVTYQAVSKWENGKNIPDISLLKQICKDFNISIEDILEGKIKSKKITNKYIYLSLTGLLLFFIIIYLFILSFSKNEFEFKTISSNCSFFNITGSIAFNKAKSSIYISNIKYCGGDDNTIYKEINCTLYESHNNIKATIDKYNKKEETTLEKFLQDVKFNVDNYENNCKNLTEENLYIEIEATDKDDKVTFYKIPLSLEKNCPK